eukprot:278802-Pelagomonas_calceolata.AAC.1
MQLIPSEVSTVSARVQEARWGYFWYAHAMLSGAHTVCPTCKSAFHPACVAECNSVLRWWVGSGKRWTLVSVALKQPHLQSLACEFDAQSPGHTVPCWLCAGPCSSSLLAVNYVAQVTQFLVGFALVLALLA